MVSLSVPVTEGQFKSVKLQKFFEQYGVHLRLSSSYFPQWDKTGTVVENLNHDKVRIWLDGNRQITLLCFLI